VVPMAPLVPRSISGHVFRVERKHGPVWYAKYRLPDGRQVQKKLGPAWTERGRPAAGYFTKRTAEAWLRDVLDEARRGTLAGLVRTGVRFAEAAEDYLLWLEFERDRKPSTLRGYRTIVRGSLLPTFGDVLLEDLTPERWSGSRRGLAPTARSRTRRRSGSSPSLNDYNPIPHHHRQRNPPPTPARAQRRQPSTELLGFRRGSAR